MKDTKKPQQDENKLIVQRREKLTALREQGFNFPNDFRRDVMAGELHQQFDDKDNDFLEQQSLRVAVAGRMMAKRVMGKASFTHLLDMSGRIQLFVQRDALAQGEYQAFKSWDVGDIVGAQGLLFKTRKGELSVRVDTLRLLTKSLRPLPEKFHGLANQEQRYRQRYLDLIMNDPVRKLFRIRANIVNYIRGYLDERGYLEVETPMMQALPGGAAARPFVTHHNALDMSLYLRIAPELYLKRLVIGGFERVYEINRNFRNEGISTQHNPEFTMLEFYEAYADYHRLMDLTEDLLRGVAQQILGSSRIVYQGEACDFGKSFARMAVKEAILHFNPEIGVAQLEDLQQAKALAQGLGISVRESYGLGKIQIEIFEKTVEQRLTDPTFITAYPTEVSPLARRNDEDPFVTDRFELFVAGKEIANGFSELNDAEDQAERFRQQAQEKAAGDEEAMHYDADYIRALEHGLPPTAGEGIGIDRLVMLLTDSPSIRDVLLFPQMRSKREGSDID
ncbi:MAG: lysine--tRNA ligase [Pseudomonadota bacterium]